MQRTHEELMKIALARPGVQKEHDALSEEFVFLNEMMKAKNKKAKKNIKKNNLKKR